MLCGIDEAGRGPVMGPLVVAGIKIDSEKSIAHLNVRDSKKLTAERRTKLAVEIRKLAEIDIVVLSANELDLMRQVLTLNEIEAIIFSKIIRKLKPDKVFVDCVDTSEENFKKNLLSKLDYEPNLISKHGADDLFPVVSAASIIAKTVRDSEIERISTEFEDEIGSGYPSDPLTINFIENWLKKHGTLPSYVRHSWKTSKRLWDNYKYPAKTLDDY